MSVVATVTCPLYWKPEVGFAVVSCVVVAGNSIGGQQSCGRTNRISFSSVSIFEK